MSRAIGVALLAASVVSCGPGYKKLNVDKIDRLAVAIDDPQQRFCAYRPVALRALVTYRNGKQARSRVPGENQKGRLRTSEFGWATSHGTVNSDAVLSLPGDPLAWYDDPIRVSARVLKRPELVGESTLHPRFDCGGTVDVRGAEGARGGEAEDGGPGEPGPEVQVALGYIDSKTHGRLALVRVQRGTDAPEYYLVDARSPQGSFVLDARGGAGGRGGQGVLGVDGRAGIDGQDGLDCAGDYPERHGGHGEPGGPGGAGANGGPGGKGGTVTVRYDASFAELATLLEIRVDGGEAGPHGSGGDGGRGGPGGRGGRTSTDNGPNAEPSTDCQGTAGTGGAAGPSGPDGQPGVAGAAGEIHSSAAEVGELFAEELQRGVPLITGASASQ